MNLKEYNAFHKKMDKVLQNVYQASKQNGNALDCYGYIGCEAVVKDDKGCSTMIGEDCVSIHYSCSPMGLGATFLIAPKRILNATVKQILKMIKEEKIRVADDKGVFTFRTL